uniref:Uncharacterized protein n=1 Tax=Arundo donax TaxID=35708 RepID=A0A0A9TEX7_ARUDO
MDWSGRAQEPDPHDQPRERMPPPSSPSAALFGSFRVCFRWKSADPVL